MIIGNMISTLAHLGGASIPGPARHIGIKKLIDCEPFSSAKEASLFAVSG
jgi:hypothetical protein